MKLALSGRLFERAGGYTLDREAFLQLARKIGYRGVELRYPQMPMETSQQDVEQVRGRLSQLGLEWAFGTVEGIHEPALFERSLKTLRQHAAGGAKFTRFTVFKLQQIEAAQRFADAAADLGQTCLMQVHANTLPDTVAHARDTMTKLDRPNIKLAYEASHLLFAGDDRYVDGIDALRPWIAAVSIQNYKPAPTDAEPSTVLTINGRRFVRAVPGDPAGLDFPAIVARLKRIGFDGYATVMCDCPPPADPATLARQWHDLLQPITR